ncbi:MAG: peptidoglycan-binding domain-containing protein [Myxococcales bacterium]
MPPVTRTTTGSNTVATSTDRPVLRKGAHGTAVRELQTLLKAKGYDVSVDGSLGSGTDRAVREFQKSQGLPADGVVGPKTWKLLAGEQGVTTTTPPTSPASRARLGTGSPSIDFNGTPHTRIEGRAANSKISLAGFNPMTQDGIALTTTQARQLGVKVGDTVTIRDRVTGDTYEATFHDSAGSKRKDQLEHFEVSPALADRLGISYRTRSGRIVDAVTNGEEVRGRFCIEG